MLLTATPSSLFNWNYELSDRRGLVARLGRSFWREKGELVVRSRRYTFEREHLLGGRFLLRSPEGEVLAEAEKPSAFSRRLEVLLGERSLVLRPTSVWGREFEVVERRRVVGHIRPAGFFTRKALVELPDDLDEEVRVFLFALVSLMWKRSSDAAASG